MAVDILDQPNGGILESLCQYISTTDGSVNKKELLSKFTSGNKNSIEAHLKILDALDIIINSENDIILRDCKYLDICDPYSENFSLHFKSQLLYSIRNSDEEHINYFSHFLGELFANPVINENSLEEYLIHARGKSGIIDPSGERLGGKVDFLKQLLTYFNFITKLDDRRIMISFPLDLFETIVNLLLKDSEPKDIFSGFLPSLESEFFPVFTDTDKTKILPVLMKTLSLKDELSSIEFDYLSDGGRPLNIETNNKEYNLIMRVD
ncbi:hypothetical protein [Methanoplanus limicola]|uniref:Uncharacterized protein n=1 Tax=Methanoplanus limicola DSM 2279 TaxID=937775 RepID=H1Z097_9EURY|nr:hypothetical protein [Methanoplanus limicola]EHQ36189.1 hypothetical protein Metlim_2107 [Methanoplanus limicola DSM 2279]